MEATMYKPTDDVSDSGCISPVSTVKTTMPFLSKIERYQHEKPYGADFPTACIEGAEITNHVFETRPVIIHNIRGILQPLELEKNGACFIKAETPLLSTEASTTKTPSMDRYIDQVLIILRQRFPQYVEIRFMDSQVRKRSTSFPDGYGEKVDFAQPAALPHTDFSVEGAHMRMADVFQGQSFYNNRSFDLLNIWKVLEGPNDDWPLAVCDYTSIDIDEDMTTNDALHVDYVGENWLLHPHENHRWHYLSGMEKDDLIVFRNTGSEGRRSCCFHAAFQNPNSTSPPRHSVEIRVVAFRD